MIKEIVLNTSTLLLITNFLCYFYTHKNHKLPAKILTWYLLIMLIIQLSTTVMASYKINNLFFSHYYFISQFFLLSLFFRSIFDANKIIKLIDTLIIVVLSSICVYYLIYPQKYFEFNNFEIALTSIPLIVYCFLFIVKNLEQPNKKYFYIVSGLLIYIVGSTLLFSTGNIKLFSPIKKVVWLMNAILHIIFQSFIFIEWYKHFRK